MNSFIQQHWEALSVLAGFATLAAITTMPKQWSGPSTAWAWFYDWSHELFSLLSQKYAGQLQAGQGVNPPSPTPSQINEEKAGLVPPQSTFPTK